jgi:hypothetical protein
MGAFHPPRRSARCQRVIPRRIPIQLRQQLKLHVYLRLVAVQEEAELDPLLELFENDFRDTGNARRQDPEDNPLLELFRAQAEASGNGDGADLL